MKRNQPELFAKAVEIERAMNRKRLAIHRDEVYLHRDLVPLDRAVGDQLPMFPENDDPCDSGYCMV